MGVIPTRLVAIAAPLALALPLGGSFDWELSTSANPLVVEVQGVEGRVSVWDENGDPLVRSTPVSKRLELDDSILGHSQQVLVTFQALGFLPQSKWIRVAEQEGPWRPRLRAARVFLYSAEGRSTRKRRAQWPKGTTSLAAELGESVSDLLGLSVDMELEEGHYIAGDVRVADSATWPEGNLHVEIRSPVIAKPLQYSLTPSLWGASDYPVHVFPVPKERALREFRFELDGVVSSRDASHPRAVLLMIEARGHGKEAVIAKRDSHGDHYSFYAVSDRVTVLRSMSVPWTLSSGAGAPRFVAFQLSAVGHHEDLHEVTGTMVLDPPQAYLRFPEDWGIRRVPGVRWSIRRMDGEIPGGSRFWFEGGGAFLEPGRYELICTDSDGQSIKMSARDVGTGE